VDLAKVLLARGANPNLRAEGGFTPLHEAALTGQSNLALLLLEHGADITAKDSTGKTALDHALAGKHDAVASILRKVP